MAMNYKELIAQMTLEEKVSLTSGADCWNTMAIPRLGIPSKSMADGPHGLRKQSGRTDNLGLNKSEPATCYPTAATLANSWNVDLLDQVGQCLGIEAASLGVNILLGPGNNMKRSPLCGRNFEYFSEDPYLSGKLAASYIKGVQSKGVSACLKHFAVNNQEERRMVIDAIVDERALREIYLTAFEIAVKEGKPWSIMSSYNSLNGNFTNENPHLLGTILQKEWGYQGIVMSDWGGCNHKVNGLLAGSHLEMPGNRGETNQEVVTAVEEGLLPEDVLDTAVDKILTLFEKVASPVVTPRAIDIEKQHEEARKAAEQSIVLLKNEEELLPLETTQKVAVIGDFAKNPRYQGAGSSIINPTRLDNALDILQEKLQVIGYQPGFKRYGGKCQNLINKACNLALRADRVLLFLGLDEDSEAEGLDRKHMRIPENQIELLEKLSRVNSNIIIVLACGAPIEMPWENLGKAIVHGYLGGQAGAGAMVNVLTGNVNPSGKLAETYPIVYQDTPGYNYFPGNLHSVEYRESIFIGYRYYNTAHILVRYPFGFGLSYTNFAYRNISIVDSGVSFELTNTGKYYGGEISQLYIEQPEGEIISAKHQLKGFCKTFLEPGETKQCHIPFDEYTFRYYDTEKCQWINPPGNYRVSIGASSVDMRLQTVYELKALENENLSSVTNLSENTQNTRTLIKNSSYGTGNIKKVTDKEFETPLGHPIPSYKFSQREALTYNHTVSQCKDAPGLFGRLLYSLLIFIQKASIFFTKRNEFSVKVMNALSLPFRNVSRLTDGMITMPMLDGLLLMINGKFFKGLLKYLKESKYRFKK